MKELGVVSATELEMPADVTESLRDSRTEIPPAVVEDS
jgi:hypothetical protein